MENLGGCRCFRTAGPFPRDTFQQSDKAGDYSAQSLGNVGIVYFALSQSPPAGKEIAVNFGWQWHGLRESIGLARNDKGFQLVEGERFQFNTTNWNQPAMAVIQINPELVDKETGQLGPNKYVVEVAFQTTSGNIPLAWSITLFVVAAVFLGLSCWHSVMLPRPVR